MVVVPPEHETSHWSPVGHGKFEPPLLPPPPLERLKPLLVPLAPLLPPLAPPPDVPLELTPLLPPAVVKSLLPCDPPQPGAQPSTATILPAARVVASFDSDCMRPQGKKEDATASMYRDRRRCRPLCSARYRSPRFAMESKAETLSSHGGLS